MVPHGSRGPSEERTTPTGSPGDGDRDGVRRRISLREHRIHRLEGGRGEDDHLSAMAEYQGGRGNGRLHGAGRLLARCFPPHKKVMDRVRLQDARHGEGVYGEGRRPRQGITGGGPVRPGARRGVPRAMDDSPPLDAPSPSSVQAMEFGESCGPRSIPRPQSTCCARAPVLPPADGNGASLRSLHRRAFPTRDEWTSKNKRETVSLPKRDRQPPGSLPDKSPSAPEATLPRRMRRPAERGHEPPSP